MTTVLITQHPLAHLLDNQMIDNMFTLKKKQHERSVAI